MIRYLINLALLGVAVTYALRRGGTPERQVAFVLLAIPLLDGLYHALGAEGEYLQVDFVHAAIDAAALVALVSIALVADRFWPLWAAALQVIAAFSHYARMVDNAAIELNYAIMIRVPFWFQILVLMAGTWNYARRRTG